MNEVQINAQIVAWEGRKKDPKLTEKANEEIKRLKGMLTLESKRVQIKSVQERKRIIPQLSPDKTNEVMSVIDTGVKITHYDYGNTYDEKYDGKGIKSALEYTYEQQGARPVFTQVVSSLREAKNDPNKFLTIMGDVAAILGYKIDRKTGETQIKGDVYEQFAQFLDVKTLNPGSEIYGIVKGAKGTPVHQLLAAMAYQAGVKVKLVNSAQLWDYPNLSDKPINWTLMMEIGDGVYGWQNYEDVLKIEGAKNMFEAMKFVNKYSTTGMSNTVQYVSNPDSGKVMSELSILNETYYLKDLNGKRSLADITNLDGYNDIVKKSQNFLNNTSEQLKKNNIRLSSRPQVDLITGRNNTHTAEVTFNLEGGRVATVALDVTSELQGVSLLIKEITKTDSKYIKIGYMEKETENTAMFEGAKSQEINVQAGMTKQIGNDWFVGVNGEMTLGELNGKSTSLNAPEFLINEEGTPIGDEKQSHHKYIQGDARVVGGKDIGNGITAYGTGGVQGVYARTESHIDMHGNGEVFDTNDTGFFEADLGLGIQWKGDNTFIQAELKKIGQVSRKSPTNTNFAWQYGTKGNLNVRRKVVDNNTFVLEAYVGVGWKKIADVMDHKQTGAGVNAKYKLDNQATITFSAEGQKLWGKNLGGKVDDQNYQATVGLHLTTGKSSELGVEVFKSNEGTGGRVTWSVDF